jgi:Neuraminidase (sialidase)
MAKVEWLKNGDRNTKYFHACSKQRMKKNLVSSIKDDGGRTWDSP